MKALPGRALAAIVAGAFLQACGYHVVGMGGQFPGGVSRVEVPIFENRTIRADAGSVITESFISQLLASGKVQLAKGAAAQAVIRGVVTSFQKAPITFDAKQQPLENRLTVVIDIALVARGSNRVLFAERNVSLHYDYPVKTDLHANDQLEDDALQQTAKLMSQRLVSLMLEGF